MQARKVDKNLINTEVTLLTDLKERYKATTGKPWTLQEGIDVNDYYNKHIENLFDKVTAQGQRVRQLKAEKAAKDVVDLQVKNLLTLKTEYKEASGSDYKPPENKAAESSKASEPKVPKMTDKAPGQEIHEKIVEQGNKIRQLKSDKSPKEVNTRKTIKFYSLCLTLMEVIFFVGN